MENVILSAESIPLEYREDSVPTQGVEYIIKMYSKQEPDEKDIAEIFLNRTRIGWLIPAISMISKEHDFSDNKYYQKHVYEIYTQLKNQIFSEKIYFLVISKRLLDAIPKHKHSSDQGLLGELSFSFVQYGLYPYYGQVSEYKNSLSEEAVPNNINIKRSFDFDKSINYLNNFTKVYLQTETNPYARFMSLYQVIELSMEAVFYTKIFNYRKSKNHLGIIREKISELSSERKLINIIYSSAGLDKFDRSLSDRAKVIFGDFKNAEYYEKCVKSDMLYDIRNALVHSYYRFDIKSHLTYLCDFIELEAFNIIEYLFRDEELRSQILLEHFDN
ncbi:hypothetical protein JGK46_004479 [Aeromonas bestiarum]|nr:hypothetical protein [Aeromonas bestiarum]EKP0280533.1 hypothetical protein [Aeromonas bestiarum]